ncbi:MAG: response regulator, partial [Sedimenticola sp.]
MAAKILVVEDESAVREMISFVLKQSDYDTLEAEDAEEARSLLADETPDLVLMDWMLPGI